MRSKTKKEMKDAIKGEITETLEESKKFLLERTQEFSAKVTRESSKARTTIEDTMNIFREEVDAKTKELTKITTVDEKLDGILEVLEEIRSRTIDNPKFNKKFK